MSVASADILFSMNSLPDWQKESEMQLQLAAPDNSAVVPLTYGVVPLTMGAGLNQTERGRASVFVKGKLRWATTANYVNISRSDDIAYLCCDNMNDSFISPSDMLITIMNNTPRAILLYSTAGNCCGIDENTKLDYQTIYTMTDAAEASDALKQATELDDGVVQATITGNNTSTQQDDQDNQGGNNSAVAMSILYSITGLITLLFLIIIATGAIRAHRYPERYGPRSGYGARPRQSRAKGLARAVLETIPIIKFGERLPTAKDDPSLELESQPSIKEPNDAANCTRLSAIPEEPQRSPVATRAIPGTTSETPTGTIPEQPENEHASQKGEEEHLGCSICTEDFKVGEDVRVLPCDHKFHPPCIDPWLINVSGTCPLCRLDLRPQNEASSDGNAPENSAADFTAVDGIMQLPPPLEAEGAENEQQTSHRNRRSSRLLDLNRLRHASVEERIEILRRHRSQQQETNQTEEGETAERHHRSRLSDKLRDKFRIRTRTQSPGRTSSNSGPSTS
ncbi:RING-7 protein [Coniochaeta sp. 2T2.1]|nr:RING-7 protein [Coniochaeta sp. 2T2.1]